MGFKKVEEANTTSELEKVRLDYLGKKGEITQVMNMMRKLGKEEKKVRRCNVKAFLLY